MNRRQALLDGARKIGVWGVGHIGYSTICHFSDLGVPALGYDIDPEKIARVNRGESPIFAMDFWLGFDARPIFTSGFARGTTVVEEMLRPEVNVHFIAVPTERNGVPWLEPLQVVCRQIAHAARQPREEPPLVIIESTLTPGTVDSVVIPLFHEEGLEVGKDVLVGCAPRRDWFSSPDKSLRQLHRVFGGTTLETTQAMREVLSIVCQNLVQAPDHFHAEVVKSIENAYRHMEIALAFELTRAFPSLDMRRVLQLVGTKWNVGTFFPSFGVGGYCIPLSSHYVLEGAERPEELRLLQQTVTTCLEQPALVAQSLIKRGVKKVGILGLSYTENVKVLAQSPTLYIVPDLLKAGIEVKVHDPHYTAGEVRAATGCETFSFPHGLDEFDAVLLVSGHREYRHTDFGQVLERLRRCKIILDNANLWREAPFASNGIEYHVAGDMGWLGDALSRNGHANGRLKESALAGKVGG